MFRNPFHKDVAKAVLWLVAALLACRFSMGAMGMVFMMVGVFCAVARRPAVAAACFMLFPLMTIANRALVGQSALTLFSARVGSLAIGCSLLISAALQMRRCEKVPILTMFLYVFVAAISSADGYMPLISYMKLLNFSIMIIGVYLLVKLIQIDGTTLIAMRVFMMAVSILMIYGSVVTRFVPSVGYSMLVKTAVNISAAEIAAMHGTLLFNGMTSHSQMLSPVVMVLATWVLYDMLLVEQRISWLHIGMLCCAPVLLYMSRSRGGFVMLAAVTVMTVFYVFPKARIRNSIKRRLTMVLAFGVVAMVMVGIGFELKDRTVSRWLRKVDDVGGDSRTLKDAVTGSRQALLEANIVDFKRNPLLGSGFQVVDGLDIAYRNGLVSWYSAPIEKGVTPYVILGETGIVGALVFSVFLIVFYGTCLRKRYLSTMTCFTCFLVSNLADSTLFSPAGMGGFLWVTSCVGGITTDAMVKRRDTVMII